MGREYPKLPIVGVGAAILDGDHICLVQRGHEPSEGLWAFPGGAVELGESLEAALRREVGEETSLEIEIEGIAAVIDHLEHDDQGRVRYHFVIVDYLARPVGGSLRPGSDARQACWASLADLDALPMTPKAQSIARDLLVRLKEGG